MLKYSDNPPMLPEGVKSLRELQGKWWVAHTRSRFEKAFAWDLRQRGIGYFLPMIDRVKVSGGRKRRVVLPLFPSYVFFCGNEEDRYNAIKTDRLCQAIEIVDEERFLAELTSIERALNCDAELAPYPEVPVGQRCRIIGGVFKGLEGVVVEHTRRARLVLSVSMLGQGAVMEIEADLLEPVS